MATTASANGPPTLPQNVSIFSPGSSDAATKLLEAKLFTRLSASASTSPDQLSAALKSAPNVSESFCLSHGNVILIFDGGAESFEVEDAHHDHFRAVCLALKDADIGLDVARCVHDADNVLQAGFQLDAMKQGSVLVIDLMHTEESEDDSDEEEEQDGS